MTSTMPVLLLMVLEEP
uniref:Uncharacterized protein n=1 Tax=Arundo donax TaxID=35708 RepID=A0A0A8Y3F6_ARUDO